MSFFSKKIVVTEGDGSHMRDNLCFDPKYIKEKWYRFSGFYFYEECRKRGIQLMTPDVYLRTPNKPSGVIGMRWSIDVKNIDAMKKIGVHQAVLIGAENPLYACTFFYNLPIYTSHFDYSIVPKGARNFVAPNSKYKIWLPHHGYWNRVRQVESNFFKKKYLTIINTNHRVRILKRIYTKVMNVFKPLTGFTYNEMYVERLEAIKYFSNNPGFDFFGWGWDEPVSYTRKYNEAIRRSYRGAVDDKFETLKKYKFSLCFENSIWSGWITEKIFDSLFAGSVPVYWGAPDVTDFIPKNCFIDYRNFKNFADLDNYLKNMDEDTYNQYIDNINKFIVSDSAYLLSKERYVSDLIDIFESYF